MFKSKSQSYDKCTIVEFLSFDCHSTDNSSSNAACRSTTEERRSSTILSLSQRETLSISVESLDVFSRVHGRSNNGCILSAWRVDSSLQFLVISSSDEQDSLANISVSSSFLFQYVLEIVALNARDMAGARGSSKRRSWLIASICYISSSFLYIDTCRQFHYSSRVRAQQQCWRFFILVRAWLRRRSEAYCVLHSETISVHWSKISWVDAISVLHQCMFLSSRWQDTDEVTIHCPTPSVCSLTYWHKAIRFHSVRIDQLKEIEMSIKKQGFLPRHASSKRLKWRGIFLEDDPKQWHVVRRWMNDLPRENNGKRKRVCPPETLLQQHLNERGRDRQEILLHFSSFLSLSLSASFFRRAQTREESEKEEYISCASRSTSISRARERETRKKNISTTRPASLSPHKHTHSKRKYVCVQNDKRSSFLRLLAMLIFSPLFFTNVK